MKAIPFKIWWILFLWRIKQFFTSKSTTMSNLSERIKTLSLEKIAFINEEAAQKVRDLNLANMNLDAAADDIDLDAAGNPEIEAVANALVNLADLADDVNLTGAQEDSLNLIVSQIVTTGDETQREKLKNLFAKTLQYFIATKLFNAYFDQLLATDPGE